MNGNKSKKKRIRRKANNRKTFNLKLLGNNVNGLYKNLESLEHVLVTEDPSIICLQETKITRSGKVKTPTSRNYTWYEFHRSEGAEKGANGRGLAIGVLNYLDPSWISEGDDNAEALAVEIWIEGFPIRLICGYGPQENDRRERKISFWEYLNEETQKAYKDGAGVIIQMD